MWQHSKPINHTRPLCITWPSQQTSGISLTSIIWLAFVTEIPAVWGLILRRWARIYHCFEQQHCLHLHGYEIQAAWHPAFVFIYFLRCALFKLAPLKQFITRHVIPLNYGKFFKDNRVSASDTSSLISPVVTYRHTHTLTLVSARLSTWSPVISNSFHHFTRTSTSLSWKCQAWVSVWRRDHPVTAADPSFNQTKNYIRCSVRI